MPDRPSLSVVVVFHNMRREAPRTLHTLSRAYQRDIAGLSYEVLAIDNGSSFPLDGGRVRGIGDEFRHELFQTDAVSPVEAVNHGVREAAGEFVMIIIDGAHLLSPGILAGARHAIRTFDDPFIATVPQHLGPGAQHKTVLSGYSQEAEDGFLSSIDWQRDGYELFRISGAPSDASLGWFGCLFESNCFCLRKSTFLRLGGFHPGYVSRGGGLVNLDFFREAVESPGIQYVMLLGEATFHQFHGGVSSNNPDTQRNWTEFTAEYERIRGRPYGRPLRRPVFLGTIPRQALMPARVSANAGLSWWETNASI
jgi:hypothetical protein